VFAPGHLGELTRIVPFEMVDAALAATATLRRRVRLLPARVVTDHHRYPASALVTLYHQRWEIETVYLELKSSILGGRVLHARTPAGIAQEIYALLATYQILRMMDERRAGRGAACPVAT
jgi:hypothetical protein